MADDNLAGLASEVASILPGLMRRFNVLTDADASMDLPIAQLRLCSMLRDGSRTMTCLAHELGISHSAVTQIADRLERAGLVERVPESDDRRVKILTLTSLGEDVMRARRESRTRRVREALEHLTPDARQQVLDGLRLLLTASSASPVESCEDLPSGV